MRILVVGVGALGGMVGARLTEAGEDVWLLEVNLARVKLLSETGLFISEGTEGERSVRVRVTASVDGQAPFDLVFVSVKSYQTEAAVSAVQSVIAPHTLVLSMQNGIGNAEAIAKLVPPAQVLSGITYHSVQHVGPNRLRYRRGFRPIEVAPFDGVLRPAARDVANLFTRAGLEMALVPSVESTVWQKLVHNAVVNPVSALTGLTCREMLDDPDLQGFMQDACGEIAEVLRKKGIPVENDGDVYAQVCGSMRALGKNRPSMWQDLARGIRTEVDAINGAVVREAERLGLGAPLNRGLLRFIHSRERQKLTRREERSDQVRAVQPRPIARAVRTTGVDPDGGMPEGPAPLRSLPELKAMVTGYYQRVSAAAGARHGKVAWVVGTGPVELLRAMGFELYFPENHAALLGASRLAGKYITRALAEGFSPFASTAMTSDIGAMLMGESPLVTAHGVDGPPKPDVIVYDTNFGPFLARWFEYYAERYQVPLLGLHTPSNLHEIGQIEVDGAVQQWLRLIANLGQLTGAELSMDRLAEVVASSARTTALWDEILNLACTVPSPLTFFDTLIHMAPVVMMRGTPEAILYYQLLKSELEERVAQHQAAVPGERFRLYWEGPPIWCALRPISRLFLRKRVAVVGSTYARLFAFGGLDPNNPIDSMAASYTSIFAARSDGVKARFLVTEFRRLGVDGVVFHDARTSPEQSNVRYGLAHRLQDKTGIPGLVLEADSHDPRLFSMDELERKLTDFIERTENSLEQSSRDEPAGADGPAAPVPEMAGGRAL